MPSVVVGWICRLAPEAAKPKKTEQEKKKKRKIIKAVRKSRRQLMRKKEWDLGHSTLSAIHYFTVGDNGSRLWQDGFAPGDAGSDYDCETESEASLLLDEVAMEILTDFGIKESVFDSVMDLTLRGPDGKLRLALHL